jgi:PAS domain S-box-containing protein
MTASRMRFAGGLAVLAAVAAAVNWHAPTVFFDSQLMLGGSLAVFAILHYGPAGLLVGLAGLVVTVIRWQHPYELLIGAGFLVWLTVFLQRLNGGWHNRGNGRLLLAALGFWLLAGFWLETGIFVRAFGLPFDDALGIGIKETVTGLANTSLGFLVFVAIGWWQARGGLETVSIRGLVFSLMLAAIVIPGIVISAVLSTQLKDDLLDDHLTALRHAGERTARALIHGEPLPSAEGDGGLAVAVLVRRPDGSQVSTDPALFARIDEEYALETPSRTGLPALEIHIPARGGPRIQVDQEAYWVTRFALRGPADPAAAAGTVVVAQPVADLINRLDSTLLPRTFGLLLGLLASGIAGAELIGAAAERQYARALAPLGQPGDASTMPPLPAVKIRELDELVTAINDRSRRVAELTASFEAALENERQTRQELDSARQRLEQTAFELTENIPVGTYTMVQPPDGGIGRFEFVSTRFLELLGLEREAVRADPFNGFACVHPDDRAEWIRKNTHTFAHKIPFREECRVVVGGETRWVLAESTPRSLPDGSTVWEGVLTDLTDRKRAEQELAEARLRERQADRRMQEILRQKLKTSLTAAAVAHEINQPLSRILLRAQLDRERRTDAAEREALDALIVDAERVVLTIQKMNVLLRNVETAHRPVDLGQVVTSGMLQLKGLLRRTGISVAQALPPAACEVAGDDVQLQMMFTNLVRNAAESLAAENAEHREIAIGIRVEEDHVELVIGDSGPGWTGGTIDDKLLDSSKPQGTGIGLFVVKTAIENHHGELAVGSSPLGGAEFRVRLPRRPAEGAGTAEAAAKPVQSSGRELLDR